MEENEKTPEQVTFNTDELMCYGVLDYEGNEMMAAITGYGLDIRFNMRIINCRSLCRRAGRCFLSGIDEATNR